MSNQGWIGVDLDGTLAHYEGWKGVHHIGAPVQPMLERVKAWLSIGKPVKIFTARAYNDGSAAREAESRVAIDVIKKWCIEHIGQELPVTCVKDFAMIELWDDRCIQVKINTGERVGE